MAELEVECVRPVTPDKEALDAISSAIQIRAEQVQQVQRELLEAQMQQDLMDEQECYTQVPFVVNS
jgi:cilia- and flagella-associated protein 69